MTKPTNQRDVLNQARTAIGAVRILAAIMRHHNSHKES